MVDVGDAGSQRNRDLSGQNDMNKGISGFALKLIFRDWRILPVSITGLGIGGAIIGHVGVKSWTLNNTLILIGAMILLTIIAISISFGLLRSTNCETICSFIFKENQEVLPSEHTEGQGNFLKRC